MQITEQDNYLQYKTQINSVKIVFIYQHTGKGIIKNSCLDFNATWGKKWQISIRTNFYYIYAASLFCKDATNASLALQNSL